MTTAMFATPKFCFLFSHLLQREPATPEDTGEDDRARRGFIQDMLARSPDAFASELDVQGMMHMYPGRF